MKCLLLGGSGFIGSNLALALSSSHEVTVTGLSRDYDVKGVNYLQLDFTNCNDFTDIIRDYDMIIHLISTIIPSDDLSNINKEISDNVFPTTILLENASKLHKSVIFISSGGTIYGEGDCPISEDSPTNPICNYGVSKLMIEKYLFLYHHFYGLDYRIVRLSNPYSEKVFHGRKQGVIPIIIDNFICGKPINIWGDGQIRDYIYIDDVVSAIRAIMEYDGEVRAFNVGSGVGYSIEDIISIVKQHLQYEPIRKFFPSRKCDVTQNVLDINLIKQEIGWEPQIGLSAGIEKIIKKKIKTEKQHGQK